MNKTTFINSSLDLAKNLCYLYVGLNNDYNLKSMLELLDDNLSVIGTGKHEFYHNKENFIDDLILSQKEAEGIEFDILNEEFYATSIHNTCCVVYGKLWLKEKNEQNKPIIVEMDTRFSIVCQLLDTEIKIIHIHHSMPYFDQRENEYYPKTIAEKANQALEYSQFLEKVVELDALTELYNRVAIENKVDDFLQTHSENYAFYMIDIDNFKLINDTYGHPLGDTILLNFSVTLKNIFESNAYIGRVGGDEFVIFMTEVLDQAQIESKAQQIIDECTHLSSIHQCQVSCSIGISLSNENYCSFSKLFSVSDKALYHSKASGKSQYSY